MKKLLKQSFSLLLSLCMVLSFLLLAGCSKKEAAVVAQPTDFSFDTTSGQFTFTGVENSQYYTVWVNAVGEDGTEAKEYSTASSRIKGTGSLSGKVNIIGLPFGTYHAKLITFVDTETYKAPEPVVTSFDVIGKLDNPEFMAAQDGTKVTVTLSNDSLSAYNTKQKLTSWTINVYDASNTAVATETVKKEDLTMKQMGPFTTFDNAAKEFTLEEGTYTIGITADGDGKYAEASDESEILTVEVKNGATSEVKTANYPESTTGM